MGSAVPATRGTNNLAATALHSHIYIQVRNKIQSGLNVPILPRHVVGVLPELEQERLLDAPSKPSLQTWACQVCLGFQSTAIPLFT